MKKMFVVCLVLGCLMGGCATEKYVRLQAQEIDGELSGGPVNGRINAKELLIITAPGRGKKGQDVYEISDKFYENLPEIKEE